MTRAICRIIVTVVSIVLIAAVAQAKSPKRVYLRDGGIIECQKVWQADGKVNVLINRDTFIVLARDEVNLKKTFPKRPAKKARKTVQARPSTPAMSEKPHPPTAAAPAATTSAPTKPGSVPVAAKPLPAPVTGSAMPAKPAIPAQKPVSSAKKATTAQQPVLAGSSSQDAKAAPQTPTTKVASPAPDSPRPNIPLRTMPAPTPASPAAVLLGSLLGTSTLVPLLAILLIIVASFWRLFTKAGEAGWKSIIPLYNLFVLVKIAGKPWWWFLLLLVPLANIVIYALLSVALAARFGQGPLFGLGLALFGFIFYPLLAFGKAEYQGSWQG